MNINEILVRSAYSVLKFQNSNGAMPAGHNGPYYDPETPVRNTSHWTISFLKTYELTGEIKYKQAAESCLSFLTSPEARPMSATFWHRKNPKKDFSNGIMGQAWTLEALEYAYRKLDDDRFLKIAEEVFLLHPYKPEHKAWQTVNVDGSIRGFDPTFNHQLWFAAIGSIIAEHGNVLIKDQTDNFLRALPNTMKSYPDGVIMHHPTGYLLVSRRERIKASYRDFRVPKQEKEYTYLKSVGYHGFNLYALGLIHNIHPNLPFFSSDLFQSMIRVIGTEKFKRDLKLSPYSFPYNPPGFELGFALQKFGDSNQALYFLKEDYTRSFSQESHQWGKINPIDSETAAARVYEAYQLENVEGLGL